MRGIFTNHELFMSYFILGMY